MFNFHIFPEHAETLLEEEFHPIPKSGSFFLQEIIWIKRRKK
jgi:hypothetical protein